MKVNLNIIEKLTGLKLPPIDELVDRVNSQLGGVEEVINLGEKYKDARIVKVVDCEKHPNADRLSVCKIDAGTGELIQVVCGAPNVHSGMWAIWLPPQSIVPSTFDDDEPFVLGARELRGVMSQGMLAAGDELAINDSHEGIVEIKDYDLPRNTELVPGMSFSSVFGLDSVVIDIENKMFTHRPDLFGQLGVAREISGIFGKPFNSPEWYTKQPEFAFGSGDLKLEAYNEITDKSQRFMAVVLSDVEIEPSPLWLQTALISMGAKPINNIVDITNYVMLMTAQPTHAYDYDKICGGILGVRLAKSGEKIKLINGKQYGLDEDDIVIADGEGPVGLAGIMGGYDSEVSGSTKNIVLEVANFDMYAVRKSAMRHGVFTDALTRFNKGQSPLQNDYVMGYLFSLIEQITSAKQASAVFDIKKNLVTFPPISVDANFINNRLGSDLSVETMNSLLHNVEIQSSLQDTAINLQIPFWRTDLDEPEDIVEEVGRLYGFDKLPRELPNRTTKAAIKNTRRQIKQKIRQNLFRYGANEVLSYSFVHENIIKRANQDVDQAFRLSNALSPDLQYYRLSVLPSLLDKVHQNIKSGHDEFMLFEIGKGHNKKYHLNDDEGLPKELNFVDGVYASKKPKSGAPFYQIRRIVSQLGQDLGLKLIFKQIDETLDFPLTAPFDQSRSALIETSDGQFVGMIGELKQSIIKNFKLPEYTAAMSLDLESIEIAVDKTGPTYRPLSRYPSIRQDVSIKANSSSTYQSVLDRVNEILSFEKLETSVVPTVIYQSKDDDQTKTITFTVTFTSHERTLSDTDVAETMKKLEQISQ